MLSGGEVTYKVTPFKTPPAKWPLPAHESIPNWIATGTYEYRDSVPFRLSGPTRKERIVKSIKDAGKDGGLGKSIHTIYPVNPYAGE